MFVYYIYIETIRVYTTQSHASYYKGYFKINKKIIIKRFYSGEFYLILTFMCSIILDNFNITNIWPWSLLLL